MQYLYTGSDKLIHSTELSGVITDYYSTDSSELHHRNQRHPGHHYDSHRWDNSTIQYQFNSLGFRTPELESVINSDRWFLVLGCSYTVGVGLPAECRWPDLISKRSGIPHINLALEGTGLDYCVYQSRLFLKNYRSRPEFVIIQHSEGSRVLHAQVANKPGIQVGSAPEAQHEVISHSEWHRQQSEYPHILTHNFRLGQLTNWVTEMWNLSGVPVYHWTSTGDGDNHLSDYHVAQYPEDTGISQYEPDWARDGAHDGVNTHALQAEWLWDSVQAQTPDLNTPAHISRCWHKRNTEQYQQWQRITAERAERDAITGVRRTDGIIYR